MEHTTVTLSVLTIGALCCASTSTGAIINPSFESQHHGPMPNGNFTSVRETWGMPDDWPWRNDGSTNAHGIHYNDEEGWSSHGDWSLYVFASTAGSHSPGHYIEFYQDVDLTGMTELLFDVYLKGGSSTNSYVAVDSQKLWVRNQAGTLYDASVDISGFSGVHEIEVGVEVFRSFGARADGWTYFDNLRIIPEPATLLLLGLGGLASLRRHGA